MQLSQCDGKQITSSVEVHNEMEPSSEDEEGEENATCNDAVSKEIACGMTWGSATGPSIAPLYMIMNGYMHDSLPGML